MKRRTIYIVVLLFALLGLLYAFAGVIQSASFYEASHDDSHIQSADAWKVVGLICFLAASTSAVLLIRDKNKNHK